MYLHGSGVSACSSDIPAWSELLALGSKDECLGGRGCMHDLNIMVMELGKSEKRRDKICEREMLSQYAFSRPHPNHLLDVKTTLKQTQ